MEQGRAGLVRPIAQGPQPRRHLDGDVRTTAGQKGVYGIRGGWTSRDEPKFSWAVGEREAGRLCGTGPIGRLAVLTGGPTTGNWGGAVDESTTAIRVITTESAPRAIGPYSQAIVANGMIFTAGQIPLDPATMKVVDGGITAQAEQVMLNLGAVLAAAGSGFDRVVKTTCFLTDLADFPIFNEIYGRSFGAAPPARSTVQVAALPLGVLVEVECVALVADRS